MSSFLGLSASNWMIWVTMAIFIVAYFAVTEMLNKKEDE